MLKGFRDFILRGNIIDLAIAVVIGTAFTALVASVTDALLKPLIGLFLGGASTSGGTLTISDQQFKFGQVINAGITFLITAAVVYFLVVVPTREILERLNRGDVAPPVAVPEDIVLLREIRDALLSERGVGGTATAPEPGVPPVG
ncbi:large conductance mechanosensitive channel [Motilibacter rhizosphaerae]|uniref:Large-conductance mechanosensitive channel n=1 Tax=Motilibacter rhizosphaerae TaxID=598652 RepID=A0A4V2F4G0_9ACTN|nr:large conductance mechanosensitive channel protein MscL [Motilibacter rhizosphaerae]RZS87477.1 large conductance mechanosensitive channel [Motilibacter rhizosphaerae]